MKASSKAGARPATAEVVKFIEVHRAHWGIEPICKALQVAAELLVTAGDNGDRIRSEAALAKLCGACPIPASSGQTTGRHRLNRGGNRQANAALYRVIVV